MDQYMGLGMRMIVFDIELYANELVAHMGGTIKDTAQRAFLLT